MLVMLGSTSCAAGLSEADANQLVEQMLDDPLLAAPPGSRIIETTPDPCGGGSVAPGASRTFSGGPAATGLDAYYTRLLEEQGWSQPRVPEAGGLAASKGPIRAYIGTALDRRWTVSLQHGDEKADCR